MKFLRREAVGLVAVALGDATLTAVLAPVRGSVGLLNAGLCYGNFSVFVASSARAIARGLLRSGRAKVAAAVIAAAVVGAGCGGALPTKQGVKDELYGNFQTAVASDRNYDAYWLGRSFEAGGLTYEGPEANAPVGSDSVGAGINPPTADRIQMSYLAPDCKACPGIDIVLYSRAAWDRFPPKTELPSRRKTTVQVNGQPAELWTRFYSPGGDIGVWTLVIDYGTTVVEATASPFAGGISGGISGGVTSAFNEATFKPQLTQAPGGVLELSPAGPLSPAAGSEVAPSMHEATFLAVMQNLRPYPE